MRHARRSGVSGGAGVNGDAVCAICMYHGDGMFKQISLLPCVFWYTA